MEMHKIEVGIEHLMTGIVFVPAEGCALQFIKISASIMAAVSDKPFIADWPNRSMMCSIPFDFDFKQSAEGEVQWYAQVIAENMRREEQRLYDMQTYTRTAWQYGLKSKGGTGHFAP